MPRAACRHQIGLSSSAHRDLHALWLVGQSSIGGLGFSGMVQGTMTPTRLQNQATATTPSCYILGASLATIMPHDKIQIIHDAAQTAGGG